MEPIEDKTEKKWDLFISHSSEDKITFVNELVSSLARFDLKVWYDTDQLLIGDSLSKTIDFGLTKSSYGLLILTKTFIAKKWPEYEYRSLLMKEMNGQKIILPIWHNVDMTDILEYSPYLADKFAFDSAKMSTEQIAFGILKVIKPNIAESILRYITFKNIVNKSTIARKKLNELKESEIRHDKLPKNLMTRLRIIYYEVFCEISEESFEKFVQNFRKDLHPQDEIAIWENILASRLEYIKKGGKLPKKSVYSILLSLSLGMHPIDQHCDDKELNKIISIWINICNGEDDK